MFQIQIIRSNTGNSIENWNIFEVRTIFFSEFIFETTNFFYFSPVRLSMVSNFIVF